MAVLSLIISGLLSAGLTHATIWALTSIGAIDGPYMAYRHDAIVAAMLAAAIAGCVFGIIALACAFASGVRGGDAWFGALQRAIAGVGPARALLVIGTVQLGAIVASESVEQVLQFGHTLGPIAALGAPLVVAIPIFVLCAVAVVSLIFVLARAIVRAESHLRGLFAPRILRRSDSSPAEIARPYRATDDLVRLAPLALRTASRPPPSIAA
jgi:hypothetical protein